MKIVIKSAKQMVGSFVIIPVYYCIFIPCTAVFNSVFEKFISSATLQCFKPLSKTFYFSFLIKYMRFICALAVVCFKQIFFFYFL